MEEERVDFRTPREAAIDAEAEEIAVRFRELMTYCPSVHRAMIRIAEERHSNRETIRARLIRCGAYIPGYRRGRSNNNQVK